MRENYEQMKKDAQVEEYKFMEKVMKLYDYKTKENTIKEIYAGILQSSDGLSQGYSRQTLLEDKQRFREKLTGAYLEQQKRLF